jgi:hypothetical protein
MTAAAPRQPVPAMTAAAKVLAWAAAGCVVAFGGKTLMGRLEGFVLARPEYRTARGSVTINEPEFMPADLFRRVIQELNDLPERFSAADPEILRRVYDSYRINPWVQSAAIKRGDKTFRRSELSVQHVWPNGIRVTITYRRPAALVAHGGAFYVIDGTGVLLADGWEDGRFAEEEGGIAVGPRGGPGRWIPLRLTAEQASAVIRRKGGAATAAYPVIEGVAGPVPKPGDRWSGPALEAALSMLGWLDGRDPADPSGESADAGLAEAKASVRREIKSVVVYREELRTFVRHGIRLKTASDTLIDWGRPPGADSEAHIDPPADKKLERLRQVQTDLGGLDGKFRTLSLRAGRRESGLRGVSWIFPPPEGAAVAGHVPPAPPTGNAGDNARHVRSGTPGPPSTPTRPRR